MLHLGYSFTFVLSSVLHNWDLFYNTDEETSIQDNDTLL